MHEQHMHGAIYMFHALQNKKETSLVPLHTLLVHDEESIITQTAS